MPGDRPEARMRKSAIMFCNSRLAARPGGRRSLAMFLTVGAISCGRTEMAPQAVAQPDAATAPEAPVEVPPASVCPSAGPQVCDLTCDELTSQWRELVRDPSLQTCQADSDCRLAGGPAACVCGQGIADCGQVVGAAYESSIGPVLEERFADLGCAVLQCRCSARWYGCIEGTCTMLLLPTCSQ